MEHVVFYPAPDGAPAFRRVGSLDDAVRFVEHLRNVESVSEFSVYTLRPVPVTMRTYYRVELPEEAVAEVAAAAEPIVPVSAVPEPSSALQLAPEASAAEPFAAAPVGPAPEPVAVAPVEPAPEPVAAAQVEAAPSPSSRHPSSQLPSLWPRHPSRRLPRSRPPKPSWLAPSRWLPRWERQRRTVDAVSASSAAEHVATPPAPPTSRRQTARWAGSPHRLRLCPGVPSPCCWLPSWPSAYSSPVGCCRCRTSS